MKSDKAENYAKSGRTYLGSGLLKWRWLRVWLRREVSTGVDAIISRAVLPRRLASHWSNHTCAFKPVPYLGVLERSRRCSVTGKWWSYVSSSVWTEFRVCDEDEGFWLISYPDVSAVAAVCIQINLYLRYTYAFQVGHSAGRLLPLITLNAKLNGKTEKTGENYAGQPFQQVLPEISNPGGRDM
jgi:hypothetical protein